jgi:signal transduction histidine kinase
VVALGRDAGRAQLTVDDSGPGVAPADRARVMTRFHRGKHVDRAGCGLGLSIVEQVAQLHRAEVQLTDSGLGGLRVAVGFPASD